jgi:peptide deformylase
MAILQIVEYPDKRLKQRCDEVPEVTDDIRKLASDMAETMYDAPGIGLAASQVGVLKRIVVCDVSTEEEPSQLYHLINPEIVKAEGETYGEEGCLSVPGSFEEVKRAARVTVNYLDLDGKPQSLETGGLLAVCLQHEIDHLNGVLFIDRLSSLKRKLAARKTQRFQQERNHKLQSGEDVEAEI